ncbi:Alba [Geosmithia morbida]|uniref:Alba n=1 Tax=Geosmithia morbida TaxID=1094350 RepID=A0A9P4YWJ8_9HYPO|nr:Alba [Geosmithia morbida]KAF4124418.1 Alba [Geosmithia morbida]
MTNPSVPCQPPKLPPLPHNARIQKRPLTRPQQPSSSRAPTVYISSSTPFMSAVKRIRKRLEAGLRTGAAPKMASVQSRVEGLRRMMTRDGGGGNGKTAAAAKAAGDSDSEGPTGSSKQRGLTTVKVVGTGRAVDKTLRLAGWFEQQGDCVVHLRTRTVATVDDVIVDACQGDDDDDEHHARLRKMSCLELSIRLR